MDIFKNPTSRVPTNDPQIVRVMMDQNEIAGRKDNLPTQSPKSDELSIKHIPNQG